MEKTVKQTIEYENYKKEFLIMIGIFSIVTILFVQCSKKC